VNYPYMPKSTALWLIENTSLSFEQIAEFCGLHELEIKSLADEEVHKIAGTNPVVSGQLTAENIAECEKDPEKKLHLTELAAEIQKTQDKKGAGYTPMMHRKNRLGGILWIVRNYPDLSDGQIAKLARSTRPTVASIRGRTHKNFSEIHIQSPIVLGLVSESALREQLAKIKK